MIGETNKFQTYTPAFLLANWKDSEFQPKIFSISEDFKLYLSFFLGKLRAETILPLSISFSGEIQL